MCPECKARRDKARRAWIEHRLGETAKHVVVGAAEALGLKEKTALFEPDEPSPVEYESPGLTTDLSTEVPVISGEEYTS